VDEKKRQIAPGPMTAAGIADGSGRKNGISIQEIIEEKLGIMCKAPVKLVGLGENGCRGPCPQSGVQFFKPYHSRTPREIKRGLNSLLPDDIHVKKADYVPHDFHSRLQCHKQDI